VRELTAQQDAGGQRIHELQEEARTTGRTIRSRDQELAALHFAIMDTERTGTKISRQRRKAESEVVDGWQHLITTLLQTPLLMTQRWVIAEVTAPWTRGEKSGRIPRTASSSRLNLPTCVARSSTAWKSSNLPSRRCVRMRMRLVQKFKPSWLASCPGGARGQAQYIHYLITMLAASLPKIEGARRLEVQVAYEAAPGGDDALLLSLLISPTENDEALHSRLIELAATPMFQAGRRAEAELEFRTAWQLASAMGGSPALETTEERKVLLQIRLPLPGPSCWRPAPRRDHAISIPPKKEERQSRLPLRRESDDATADDCH